MPIFEFECRECGAKFEKLVSSSSNSVTCQKCASTQVTKLLSVFAVSGPSAKASTEPGPCACGAPRRGMCQG
ncbi:MAG: zinc ribbon domain-containing protein [Terriglobia bacterium]